MAAAVRLDRIDHMCAASPIVKVCAAIPLIGQVIFIFASSAITENLTLALSPGRLFADSLKPNGTRNTTIEILKLSELGREYMVIGAVRNILSVACIVGAFAVGIFSSVQCLVLGIFHCGLAAWCVQQVTKIDSKIQDLKSAFKV